MTQSPYPRTKLLDIFGALFITVLLLSMIMAQKLFVVFGVTFTTAIIIFPLSYILGDILTEVYGYGPTRRIIWSGFAASVLMVIFLEISVQMPPAPGWPNELAYEAILHQVPRTVGASLMAYLLGEFANSFVLAKLKVATSGRMLWLRTIGSTLVGQAVDTTVFIVLAFWGTFPPGVVLEIIVSAYIFKVLYEVAATPLTYLVVGWVKRREGIDAYDRNTNFTPFRLSAE